MEGAYAKCFKFKLCGWQKLLLSFAGTDILEGDPLGNLAITPKVIVKNSTLGMAIG